MTWNNAMKLAKKNAILKKNLAETRVNKCWMALDNEDQDANIDFVRDCLTPVISEYEFYGEDKQASWLSKMVKDYPSDYFEREEWCVKIGEFFEEEVEFFGNLINKYDRYLKTEPPKHEVTQLTFL